MESNYGDRRKCQIKIKYRYSEILHFDKITSAPFVEAAVFYKRFFFFYWIREPRKPSG